jgi:hypothetical protein
LLSVRSLLGAVAVTPPKKKTYIWQWADILACKMALAWLKLSGTGCFSSWLKIFPL